MKIFKGGRNQWFVICEDRKEKREMFTVIEKREPTSIYFYPDGGRHEQFSVSREEADKINEQIRANKRRSS